MRAVQRSLETVVAWRSCSVWKPSILARACSVSERQRWIVRVSIDVLESLDLAGKGVSDLAWVQELPWHARCYGAW